MNAIMSIPRIDGPETFPPESVIGILDRHAVKAVSIGCDNWHWSDRNPSVSLRAAHSGDSILLHFHVEDNELRAEVGEDDGRVWEDSCCEFFVSPDSNGLYYNFECNCIGTLLLHYGSPGDRPAAPAGAFRAVRRWSSLGDRPFGTVSRVLDWDLVEIIPVSALFRHDIKDLSGLEMTANFYKCGDLLPHPHFLSWAPISLEKPMFHCPQFFGKIKFE